MVKLNKNINTNNKQTKDLLVGILGYLFRDGYDVNLLVPTPYTRVANTNHREVFYGSIKVKWSLSGRAVFTQT